VCRRQDQGCGLCAATCGTPICRSSPSALIVRCTFWTGFISPRISTARWMRCGGRRIGNSGMVSGRAGSRTCVGNCFGGAAGCGDAPGPSGSHPQLVSGQRGSFHRNGRGLEQQDSGGDPEVLRLSDVSGDGTRFVPEPWTTPRTTTHPRILPTRRIRDGARIPKQLFLSSGTNPWSALNPCGDST
jgi:hypothetical protein